MDLIHNLLDFFKKPKHETKGKTPEGQCPLCWGYGEYDHKIRKVFEDKQIDVNNHKDRYMLIQKFAKKHVDGIKLKESEIQPCQKCGHQPTKN
ncbi:MAG TPA: hypothetical protein VFM65_11135 [Flavobacteriaceae bacterium]|nr:hypothetical protein [Flavobacteriaceae bacterium]